MAKGKTVAPGVFESAGSGANEAEMTDEDYEWVPIRVTFVTKYRVIKPSAMARDNPTDAHHWSPEEHDGHRYFLEEHNCIDNVINNEAEAINQVDDPEHPWRSHCHLCWRGKVEVIGDAEGPGELEPLRAKELLG